MKPRTPFFRTVIYLLLIAGALGFSLPLLWLVSTSLKPIEQTMQMPPTWLPRANYVQLDGKRVEVIRDYQIEEPSVLLGPAPGNAGRSLAAEKSLTAAELAASVTLAGQPILERIEPGWWHVTERSRTKIQAQGLLWAVVPESAIETQVAPRWENYPLALKTFGGTSIDEVEGSVAASETGAGEDSRVPFWRFLVNTLIVCTLGVTGAVLSNAIIAYGFSRIKWPGRDLFFAITVATMMVPFPVLMVPLYGVFKSLGWIGTLTPLWAPAFFGSAFNIFLMRQFFRTIPEDLSEAARIDGCSDWGIFWRVILPLSKPVLAVVALFQFLFSWNDFLGPMLFLTRKHTFTLALALQNYQSQHGGVQWHYLMAASTVVILPIIVLFFLTQKTFIRGIVTTGLKG